MTNQISDDTRIAMLQVIIGRQLRSFKVYLWPAVTLAISIFLFFLIGSPNNPVAAVVRASSAIVVVFAGFGFFIAVREARNATIELMIKLEKIPIEKWFWVTGVSRSSNCFVIHVRDFFGNDTDLYSCYEGEDFFLKRKWKIAQALESQWMPVVKKLSSLNPEEGAEKETKTEPIQA